MEQLPWVFSQLLLVVDVQHYLVLDELSSYNVVNNNKLNTGFGSLINLLIFAKGYKNSTIVRNLDAVQGIIIFDRVELFIIFCFFAFVNFFKDVYSSVLMSDNEHGLVSVDVDHRANHFDKVRIVIHCLQREVHSI